MRYTEDLIEIVRSRSDIVEVVSETVTLKKTGQNYTGLCPFHNEKTGSFVVSPAKQIYHCFGCGKGGNVFSFVMERDGCSFIEAVEKLANKYGIALPEKDMSQAQLKKLEHFKRMYTINDWAADFYSKVLISDKGKAGLEYFKNRQLSDESIKNFRLGFSPDSWDDLTKYLKNMGVSDEELISLGLSVKTQKGSIIDKFRNRAMFPISDDKGKVLGFGGRTLLADEKPKYLNTSDSPLFNKSKILYGIHLAKNNIRTSEKIVFMEGYMDVITSHQYGINTAVASMGTALTKDQIRLAQRYTYNVNLCYDQDMAGQNATLRNIELLNAEGIEPKIIMLSDGKDPDEYLKAHGADSFIKAIDSAETVFEYKFHQNCRKVDLNTNAGKVKAITESIPDLSRIKSPVARQGYIQMMADELRFSENIILAELKQYGNPKNTVHVVNTAKNNELDLADKNLEKAIFIVLSEVIGNNQIIHKIEQYGGKELFAFSDSRELYTNIKELLDNNQSIKDEEELLLLISSDKAKSCLTRLMLLDNKIDDEIKNKVFCDALTLLVKRHIDKEIENLTAEMDKLDRAGDSTGAINLMSKIAALNKDKRNICVN